jgi:heme exporter protein B
VNTAIMAAPFVSPGQAALVLVGRELRLAWRRWGQSLHPVIFFLMVTTLFPLALSPESARLRLIAGGVVWVGALLSSLLALETLFRADLDDGTLEQLVLSGQPLAILMLAKTLAHWLLSGVPLVLATPVALGALAVPAPAYGPVMLGILLGTGVLSFLGGIGAALTLGTRRGSVLLSLLVLPLAMPVLIFGARAADLAIRGESFAGGLLLLAAMLVLTVTLAPLATAVAVRICLE